MQPQQCRPSFAEMAVCLRECAEYQRSINEWGGDLFGPKTEFVGDMKMPLDWAPGTRAAFAEMVRKEQMLFAAHLALKEMSDHEQQIRALVGRRSIVLRIVRAFVRVSAFFTTSPAGATTKETAHGL